MSFLDDAQKSCGSEAWLAIPITLIVFVVICYALLAIFVVVAAVGLMVWCLDWADKKWTSRKK